MSNITDWDGKRIVMAAIASAAIGAAVGAGTALLLAPRSGKDTRRWLAGKSGDITTRATAALDHGKQALRSTVRELGRDTETPSASSRS